MGNRLGWILAGGLVVVVGGIFLAAAFPSPSPPTRRTLADGMLDMVEFPMTPQAVTGRPMAAAGDAGKFYNQAMEMCRSAAEDIEQMTARADWRELTAGKAELLPAQLQQLAEIAEQVGQGAMRKDMNFVLTYTPKKLEIASDLQAADDLQNLLTPLWLYAAALIGQGQHARAERVYCDALTMGYHFMAERARVSMTLKGAAVQKAACRRLAQLYGQSWPQRGHRAVLVEDYHAAVAELSERYRHKNTIIADLRAVRESPGDVFNIAANDEDRAWRVEGILTLGIVKYAAADRGDKRQVRKLTRKFLASDDPLEAAAAKAVDGFTIEQYRLLSSRAR